MPLGGRLTQSADGTPALQVRIHGGELQEQYSADQMKRTEAALPGDSARNEKGPWKPTWESLDRHRTPEWLLDAKLGVQFNWGLYSVPAWDQRQPGPMYPDAYACLMYERPGHIKHHAQTWGKDVQYDDFFPLLTAENYNPEEWIKLLDEVGTATLCHSVNTMTAWPGGIRPGASGTMYNWVPGTTCSLRWCRRPSATASKWFFTSPTRNTPGRCWGRTASLAAHMDR